MEKYCYICGRPISGLYYKDFNNLYICNNEDCFNTYFWDDLTNRLSTDKFHEYAIINHKVYLIGSESDDPKGFGGKYYSIQFNDGTIRNTTSLWFKGNLPSNLEKDFQDNAIFLKKGF